MGAFTVMISSNRLAQDVTELSRKAITDIHEHWTLIPKSPQARQQPEKYSVDASVRYAVSQAVVKTYQETKG
jgi:hypothetical protein